MQGGAGAGLGLSSSRQFNSLAENDVLKTSGAKEQETELSLKNTSASEGTVPLEGTQADLSNSSISFSASSSNSSKLLESPSQKVTVPESREKSVLKTEEVESGNCSIDNSMASVLKSQSQSEQEYYSISCTNVGIGDETDTSFQEKWGGAFPKVLFNSQDWTTTKKLEVKVKTDFPETPVYSEYPNSIEFWSEQFKDVEGSKIIGGWDYKSELSDLNGSGAIVKLTHPQISKNIYLLLDLEQKEI